MTNTGASSHTVTVATVASLDGQPVEDKVFTLAASASLRAVLGPVAVYGRTVTVTASNAEVTLAAYQL